MALIMVGSAESTLVIGRVPQDVQDVLIPAVGADICRAADARACGGMFPRVIADASFDYFDYLRFGEELLALRDRVAVGGELALVRRPGQRDSYFVYRDDQFFRHEFPAVFEADFERVEVIEDAGHLCLRASGRRPRDDADQRRSQLPWRHLAHAFTFAGPFLPPPNYAWVPATFRCNLRCRTCSVRNDPPGADISTELIDRMFDAIGASLDVINVTGIGEPLFARSWPHLRRRIRERPWRRLEIVTNAMLLTEEEVRDMMREDHPTILVVSIDGARKETFEYIRDRAKWERLEAAMDMIARLRRELNPGPLFALGVDFVAVKDNITELPELIPRLAAWGVDLLLVIEMGDWRVNHDFYYEQALRFHPRLANEYYDKARAVAARYPFRLVSIPPNYTDEAVAAVEQREQARPGILWRVARPIYRALRAAPPSQALGRAAVRLLDAWCARPVGLPRRAAWWVRQQLAMSRIEGFGEFRRVQGFCDVIAERAYLHLDGQLATCCGLMDPKFGNLCDTGFGEIWHSPAWRELRLRNLFGFPHTGCYFCTLPYGLPEKNPENYMAAHQPGRHENWLAGLLRRLHRDWSGSGH